MADVKDVKRGSKRLNAYDQLLAIIVTYQKFAYVFGFDLYRNDYTFNWKIKLSFVWTLAGAIDCVYLFVYNLVIGDRQELFKSICFLAVVIQQECKTLNIVLDFDSINLCHERVDTLTKSSDGPSERTLFNLNSLFGKIGKSVFFIYYTSITALALYPAYVYWQSGEKESIVKFFLPFVDDNTTIGYTMNLISQCLHVFNTASVHICSDCVIFYYLMFAGSYVELVEHKCTLLSKTIREAEKTGTLQDKKTQKVLHAMLVDAIELSQAMNAYFDNVKFIEKWLLVQIGCQAYTLMVCIFVVKFTGWMALYIFIPCYLFQLGAYSVAGTYIEAKYDRLPHIIYEIPWYHLTVSDQKLLTIFLLNSQSPKKFYLIGEKSMNVETGIAILKAIYSAYVMLDTVY